MGFHTSNTGKSSEKGQTIFYFDSKNVAKTGKEALGTKALSGVVTQ
jgi:hypothetical protein